MERTDAATPSRKPFALPRCERLRSMKAIRRMFGEGQGGFVYPFRYVFVVDRAEADVTVSDGSVEMLFSVPKKFHKRANRRNLLKRRTREAYRLGREELRRAAAAVGAEVDAALIYSTKECHSYKTIENAVRRILEQIGERI